MKPLLLVALSIAGVIVTSQAFAVRHKYVTTQAEADQLIAAGYWEETSPGYIYPWGPENWATKRLYRMYKAQDHTTKLVVGTAEYAAAKNAGWTEDARLGLVLTATNWVCDLDPALPVLLASYHSTFKDWFYTTDEYEDYYAWTYLGYSEQVASGCLLTNPDGYVIALRRFYKQDGY